MPQTEPPQQEHGRNFENGLSCASASQLVTLAPFAQAIFRETHALWRSICLEAMLISGFRLRCDSRLERNTLIGPRRFRRCACPHLFCPFRVLVVWILIGGDQVPTEMSEMPPALKDHPALKWLSFGRHDQAIVLPPCFPVRVSPVEFECLEF